MLQCFIIVDETCVHYCNPETKEQSKQLTAKDDLTPKKAKTFPSAGNVMATVLWDFHGFIFVDYLEEGKTINGGYYAAIL